jgi:thioredoxin 1
MIEVLDFFANWCAPCQMMKPVFAELEKEYEGKVKFTTIDVDEHPDISTSHHVLSIPTYIIMRDNQEVDRLVGYTSKQAFEAKLNSHIV